MIHNYEVIFVLQFSTPKSKYVVNFAHVSYLHVFMSLFYNFNF